MRAYVIDRFDSRFHCEMETLGYRSSVESAKTLVEKEVGFSPTWKSLDGDNDDIHTTVSMYDYEIREIEIED